MCRVLRFLGFRVVGFSGLGVLCPGLWAKGQGNGGSDVHQLQPQP